MRNVSAFINKPVVSGFIILGLFIYFSIGIFPISCFETDSVAISNACQHIIDTDVFSWNYLGHSFDMQSGTYFLIVLLSKIFNASTFFVYSIISSISAIFFFSFIVLFVRKLLGYNTLVIISVLLLFQEISSIAYYPNSTSLAAAFWMLGFLFLMKETRILWVILAGFVLSISAWLRVDILFVFPSVFPLLYISTKSLKKAFLLSITLMLIIIPSLLFLMYMSNADINGFLGYSKNHGTLFGMSNKLGVFDLHLIRAHISSYTLLIFILFLTGVFYLFKNKKWALLILVLMGVSFFYILGINNTVAPKHLIPYTPFWLITVLYGLMNLLKNERNKILIIVSLLFLFLIQYIIGYKVDISSIPYANKEYALLNPVPSYLKLFETGQVNRKILNLEVRIGAGTKIPSSDEILLSSGIIFNPISWAKMKEKTLHTTTKLANYIDTCKSTDILVMVTDGSSQVVVHTLFDKKYLWKKDTINWQSNLEFFKTSGEKVRLIRKVGFIKGDTSSFRRNFISIGQDRFLIVFLWDWQVFMMNEEIANRFKIDDRVFEYRKE